MSKCWGCRLEPAAVCRDCVRLQRSDLHAKIEKHNRDARRLGNSMHQPLQQTTRRSKILLEQKRQEERIQTLKNDLHDIKHGVAKAAAKVNQLRHDVRRFNARLTQAKDTLQEASLTKSHSIVGAPAAETKIRLQVMAKSISELRYDVVAQLLMWLSSCETYEQQGSETHGPRIETHEPQIEKLEPHPTRKSTLQEFVNHAASDLPDRIFGETVAKKREEVESSRMGAFTPIELTPPAPPCPGLPLAALAHLPLMEAYGGNATVAGSARPLGSLLSAAPAPGRPDRPAEAEVQATLCGYGALIMKLCSSYLSLRAPPYHCVFQGSHSLIWHPKMNRAFALKPDPSGSTSDWRDAHLMLRANAAYLISHFEIKNEVENPKVN